MIDPSQYAGCVPCGYMRFIVQGRPPIDPGPGPLGTALINNQTSLGYIYMGEMGQYLLSRNIDVVSALFQFHFPSYHLIAVPINTAPSVINSLYVQFHDPARPDYIDTIEADLTLDMLAPSVKIGTGFSLSAGKSMHNTYIGDLNIAAATTHNPPIDGSDIKVAVLDTGLETGKSVAGYHDLTVTGNPAQTDNHGHGTAMAEIIKAVAPQAPIYVIRVTDRGQVFVWDLMAGVTTAVHSVNADILNLSLGCKDLDSKCPWCGGQGGNRSKVCESFFDQIAQNGVSGGPDPIILAAVGNDGVSTGFQWPARFNTVVAVGAIKHNKELSSFSNTGTSKPQDVYCMCPGGNTDSANNPTEWVGEGNDAGITTHCVGTSPATAYASGILALWKHYRSVNGLATSKNRILDAAQTAAKRDVVGYKASEHGMGRLIYDP